MPVRSHDALRPNRALGGVPTVILLRMVPAARLSWLVALMVLVALSEGVGLLLLVPLLGVVGDGAVTEGPLGALLATLPFTPALGPLVGLFVALVAARALLQHCRLIESTRIERLVVRTLRRRAVAALLRADWRWLGSTRQADHASLLISDIDRIGFGCGELIAIFAGTLALGAAFLAALALSPVVAAFALAGSGVMVLVYSPLRARARRLGEQQSAAYARLYAQLGDTLGALRLIKSFAAEARSAGSLDAVDARLEANRLAFQKVAGLGQAALQIAGALLLAAVVWLAEMRWNVPLSVLLPLVALFARVVPLLGAVQGHWQSWLHARPALHQTLALITQAEAAAEVSGAHIIVAPPRRAIALAGVSLRHAGRDGAALADVDLELPVATTTALVGPSGAGKSTLADILGGLLTPDEGALRLDGRPLGPGERIAWRARVAYVQQEPVLFHATIRENLLWAVPDAGEARIAAALRDASAEFVQALPQGLDTQVGDAGRRFSGGERQRIVLARALLRDPALLILDEPTSALDPANEAAVAAAVARMRGKVTLLIIGHRGPLAEAADQLVRLDGGRIVERRLAAQPA